MHMKQNLKLFKVYFKGCTPMLMRAKDDIDAAIRCAQAFELDVKEWTYSVDTATLKQDPWGEAV